MNVGRQAWFLWPNTYITSFDSAGEYCLQQTHKKWKPEEIKTFAQSLPASLLAVKKTAASLLTATSNYIIATFPRQSESEFPHYLNVILKISCHASVLVLIEAWSPGQRQHFRNAKLALQIQGLIILPAHGIRQAAESIWLEFLRGNGSVQLSGRRWYLRATSISLKESSQRNHAGKAALGHLGCTLISQMDQSRSQNPAIELECC